MREVLADADYYAESGGGLTLSGGEALIQKEFAAELLKAARANGINTCVETALNYRSEVLDEILPLVDLFLCDLKHMVPRARRYPESPTMQSWPTCAESWHRVQRL